VEKKADLKSDLNRREKKKKKKEKVPKKHNAPGEYGMTAVKKKVYNAVKRQRIILGGKETRPKWKSNSKTLKMGEKRKLKKPERYRMVKSDRETTRQRKVYKNIRDDEAYVKKRSPMTK